MCQTWLTFVFFLTSGHSDAAMLYSCTHMATLGVRGLSLESDQTRHNYSYVCTACTAGYYCPSFNNYQS